MNTKLLIFLLLTSRLSAGIAQAQTAPTWNWVQQIGGTGLERGLLSAADGAGNVYQTGSFVGTVQVGTTVLNSVSTDMYLVKFNSQGVPQWAQQAHVQRPNGQARAEGISVTTDPAGNVYVSGSFLGTVTFGNGAVTASSLISSTFVAKFTSQGVPVWATANSGSGLGSRTDPSGLAANANGDVFVSGRFALDTTFGILSAASRGSFDIFLVKLNSAGVPQWLRSGGGTGMDYASALLVAPGNGVYLSGGLSAVATFGSLTAISRGGIDAYLMLYDAQGTPQWQQTFGGSGDDSAGTIDTAPAGELYMAGFFQTTADFGNYTLRSQGGSDGFVVKCTAQGTPLWVNAMGGSGSDGAYGVSLSSTGALYVTGSFIGTATFNGQSRTSAGGADIFVARYDAAGNLAWVEHCGGSGDEYSAGVAAGIGGTVFVGGEFSGTAQFGPLALTSRGLDDGFIVQLQDNTVTGLYSIATTGGYRLYPNPLAPGVSLMLSIPGTEQATGSINIIDLTGKTVFQLGVKPGDVVGNRILIGQLPLTPGIYLLKYSTAKISVNRQIQVQ